MNLGFPEGQKGIFFTIYGICSLLARVTAGKISDKKGRVIVLKWAVVFLIISNIVMALASTQAIFIIGSCLFGFAAGMNSPTIYAWTIDLSLDHARGKGIATMYIALEIGIGLALLLQDISTVMRLKIYILHFLPMQSYQFWPFYS